MKVHEYQAKQILAGFNVPTPKGRIAATVDEAVAIATDIGSYPVVVKAQVHVGGRGKAGGVKLARSLEEVRLVAKAILGMDIKGITVSKVLIEPGIDIKREIYLGIILDRANKRPVIMASAEGGVEIEEVARTAPEKILKLAIPPAYGLKGYHVQEIGDFLDIPEDARKSFRSVIAGLYKAFIEKDCSLAEINPLVITGSGHVIACDAKMDFDDNALPWHSDIESLRDIAEEEPLEVEARQKKLNYVKLDGRIGCIVNGAGLAMCTMDVVKHFGGEPANFLDIGGGAKAQQVADALELITSDPNVNTIFFNIFGGIVRCDQVAAGILTALEKLPGFNYPIVIRLSGTNEEQARIMLEGTPLHMAHSMAQGAEKAVAISLGRG
ncbi:ADP-forming succinate--CoA ligase subunit beta [Candidatus Poribacteria bacterium]|nr:ADP-forming succinate--CoA ligase subunit beta [Candidatus Poribacteria bacterium]